jgi:hypothetical protein
MTEAQLAGILGIADDAIITVDEAQHIILSTGAERIFGGMKRAIGQPSGRCRRRRARLGAAQ